MPGSPRCLYRYLIARLFRISSSKSLKADLPISLQVLANERGKEPGRCSEEERPKEKRWRRVTAPRRKRRSFRGLIPRLQPESQNVQGGVVVPVLFHPAARTGIGPDGQRHFLSMAAGRTVLGCTGRIDLPELSTGAFSLVRKKGEELRPRRIADVSVQTTVGNAFVDVNVLDENPSVQRLSGQARRKRHPFDRIGPRGPVRCGIVPAAVERIRKTASGKVRPASFGF